MNTQVVVSSADKSQVNGSPLWQNRVKKIAWWTLGIGSLAVIFGPAYAKHINVAIQGTLINDDVRQQIFPFYKYADSSLFNGDYIADYYRLNLPIGFHALNWLGAKLWDPEPISRALPYPLLLGTIAALAVASYRLAGGAAAWAVAALTLSSGVFMDRMVGGLPRAFGFPLLAWGIAALVAGKPKQLGVVTVLGIAFYPIVGVLLGGTLGVWLLFWPKRTRAYAESWSLRRRMTFLSVVAGGCVFLTGIVLVIGSGYGSRVGSDDIAEFPEAGKGGRYAADSRPPFEPVLTATWKQWRTTLTGYGDAVVPSVRPWTKLKQAENSPTVTALFVVLTVLVLVGYARLVRTSIAAQRLVPFILVVLGGYVAALYTFPLLYLPERYSNYAVALLAVLMTSVAAAGLVEFFKAKWSHKWAPLAKGRSIGVLAFAVVVLAFLGGRGSSTEGYTVRVDPKSALYRAIAKLPTDAVVAGWPHGPIELVPHLSRRSALVTYETHQAFHKGYMLEMRGRANALIDAYFAKDTKPLRKLRDKFGVTHFLVDFRHLNGKRHAYFKPFDKRIRKAARRLGKSKRSVFRQMNDAIAFKKGRIAVFDLSKMPL